MAKPTRWRRFRSDLTGESDRWGRTILYAVVLDRLALFAMLLVYVLSIAETDLSSIETELSGIFSGTSMLISEVNASTIVLVGFAGPIFESLILAFLVWLMSRKLSWRPWITALVCALISVPLHGLAIGSLMVAPFFWLMALVQCNWMRRGDGLGGFWIVVTMHAIANGYSLLMTAMSPTAGG